MLACVEIEAKSVINHVRGMPFEWSINPYTGCYHRCVFCYARNTHVYRELDGVRDWGTRLTAKVNAPAVLRRELATTRRDVESVCIGTATDPYQPLEGRYRLTRGIVQELARARVAAHIITRSPLVVRDVDVLGELARRAGVTICVSLPTLDEDLARRMEPTVAPPRQRLRAIAMLAEAGLRVGVAVAPVVPDLTDRESSMRALLAEASKAGACMAWAGVLHLNPIARDSYFAFLQAEFPELVPRHDAMFRREYAPKPVVAAVARRFARARSLYPLRPRRTIALAPRVRQISLL
jgi:DNA repair photolyase